MGVEDDLESLTLQELRSKVDFLKIPSWDLLGRRDKREPLIRAIRAYRADQKFFNQWQQSQKVLPLCNTPEEN